MTGRYVIIGAGAVGAASLDEAGIGGVLASRGESPQTRRVHTVFAPTTGVLL